MNDVRSPLSFHPSTTIDHAVVSFKVTVTAGFPDVDVAEAIHDFFTVMRARMETTGVRIDKWEAAVEKRDHYCGSKREKLLFDANTGDDNRRVRNG